MLNDSHRTQLLRIARDSIAAALDGGRLHLDESSFDEVLRRPAGAFVTLTKHDELRGCIGSIHAVEALYRAVSSSAVSAAFRDPRFTPSAGRNCHTSAMRSPSWGQSRSSATPKRSSSDGTV